LEANANAVCKEKKMKGKTKRVEKEDQKEGKGGEGGGRYSLYTREEFHNLF
jgi:hypothetical protein